jgi:light-regulated signal transduction histidine kinase (bacteriophytochrome)
VYGDRDQLVRLFQNVIGNALKFRGEAEPRIEIAAVPAGAQWQVSVRDNGIGFSPEYAEWIFEMFHRLGERGKKEGSGIGLAIVAKIVELHGGRAWAKGRPGEGATFFFTLPRVERRP